MKPRKVSDLNELTDSELNRLLQETQETLAKQKFQHALKQLQDTAYLKVVRKDIARIKTIINQRKTTQVNG